ncbi:GNAT family N-acetyltransferase [Sphingomonas sp. PAMC 26621]|uniref:GNAT family N-acetyltransferase n=1 Tax=Sphingomonas sp. PAMC 26621 TaxID=1112213 RepID=UPI00028A1B4B|nr:GNAT family protein [Sphingomonas sp. PAMC 26621]
MTAWTDPPTLVGQHVILRPTVPEDQDGIVAAAADGKISELFFTNVSTLTDPAAFMAALFRERDYGRSMPFTVCVPEPTPPPFALSGVEGPGTPQGLRLRSARTEEGTGTEPAIATPTEPEPTPPLALSEVEGPGTPQGLRLRSARTEGGPAPRIVGLTRYMRMNPAHRRLEIGGTFYAHSVQRSGVNTEAKLLLLKHAFEVMDCNAVQIRTDWFNKASQKAIERLGAKRDGVLRNHQLMDGRIRDLVVYSIIASEWAGVERNLRFLLARNEGKTA